MSDILLRSMIETHIQRMLHRIERMGSESSRESNDLFWCDAAIRAAERVRSLLEETHDRTTPREYLAMCEKIEDIIASAAVKLDRPEKWSMSRYKSELQFKIAKATYEERMDVKIIRKCQRHINRIRLAAEIMQRNARESYKPLTHTEHH